MFTNKDQETILPIAQEGYDAITLFVNQKRMKRIILYAETYQKYVDQKYEFYQKWM